MVKSKHLRKVKAEQNKKKILQDRKDKVKKNQYLILEGEIQR